MGVWETCGHGLGSWALPPEGLQEAHLICGLTMVMVILFGSFRGSESAFHLGLYLQQCGEGQEESLSHFTDFQAFSWFFWSRAISRPVS